MQTNIFVQTIQMPLYFSRFGNLQQNTGRSSIAAYNCNACSSLFFNIKQAPSTWFCKKPTTHTVNSPFGWARMAGLLSPVERLPRSGRTPTAPHYRLAVSSSYSDSLFQPTSSQQFEQGESLCAIHT